MKKGANVAAKTAEKVTEEVAVEAKVADKPKKVTMAKFVDGLLTDGAKLEDIVAKAQKEAKKRNVNTLATVQLVRSHINYRINKGMAITFKENVVATA